MSGDRFSSLRDRRKLPDLVVWSIEEIGTHPNITLDPEI
jgi:hypothetical protein